LPGVNSRGRLLAGLAAVVASALATPAVAQADCSAKPVSQVFRPWYDPAWYEAAPNGSFEAGSDGWTLGPGATVVHDNEPYLAGSRALSLPAGAWATTQPMCVDLARPTVRFFARSGSRPGALVVTAIFRDELLGFPQELPVGEMLNGSSWTPSPVMLMAGNLLSGEIAFRFTSSGTWALDDVYVDPYSKG
jgi:hypothetical protein